MKSIYIGFVMVLYIVVFSNVASAENKKCTKEEAEEANAMYDVYAKEVWTWNKLFLSFKKYGHCSIYKSGSGSVYAATIAQSYSDAVKFLLIDHWIDFKQFSKLARKNKEFQEFVLSNISMDFSPKDIKVLINNAQKKCPKKKDKALCKLIEDEAKADHSSKDSFQ